MARKTMRPVRVWAKAAAAVAMAKTTSEREYVRRRPWTSDTLPKGRRKAAVVIRKIVTTQLMRSGVTPNWPAMTGMAILMDVERKGPTKLIRQIE